MSAAVNPAWPDTGKARFKRLRVGVVALGVLVIAVFGGSTAIDAYRSHRHAVIATDREINNVAKALAEQTAWSLQSVDLVLLDTARWYRNDSHEIPPERLGAVMQNRTPRLPQVHNVVIVDAQGIQRFASIGSPTPNLNVADRSYFTAHRDGRASGLYMSEPLVTRSEGRDAIILSRRLDDDTGGFAGVVAANVDNAAADFMNFRRVDGMIPPLHYGQERPWPRPWRSSAACTAFATTGLTRSKPSLFK